MRSYRGVARPVPVIAGRLLREVALVAVGLLVYFLIRGSVTDRAGQALLNAIAVIELQQGLGIFWEPEMQRWILGSVLGIRFWNAVYFWLHAPAIVGVGLWLLWRHYPVYVLIRNAFLVSAVIALVCYYLYPVAPPRLVSGYGFVDTMQVYSQMSYQAQSLKPFVNPYAAMPSLHFGWSFLLSVGIVLARRDRVALLLAILLTILMGLAILFTANHYILDGVAGLLVAGVGLALASRWDHGQRPRRRILPSQRRRRAGAPGTI